MLHVTAGIIYKGGKILIARRSLNKHLAGFWEFPGGKIEQGESAEECLKRELEEELNINVKVGALFMENQHEYGDRRILLYAYFCKYLSGEITLKDHDKVEWIHKEELINYQFAPADIPFIKVMLDGKQ